MARLHQTDPAQLAASKTDQPPTRRLSRTYGVTAWQWLVRSSGRSLVIQARQGGHHER